MCKQYDSHEADRITEGDAAHMWPRRQVIACRVNKNEVGKEADADNASTYWTIERHYR